MVNSNISSGTCYFKKGSETKGDFIPCGNGALGFWPCCKAGDFCLAFDTANACYDAGTSNTYIAGCTDKDYGNKACPQKGSVFDDQEWVGIQQCGEDNSGNTQWGGCRNNPVNSTSLSKLPHDQCDSYCSNASAIIYVGSSSLPAFATLPTTASGAITWASDFDPSSVTANGQAATATGDGPTKASATTTASTPSNSASSTSTSSPTSDGGGLDTGAKIGIGVGVAGAALLAVIAGLLFWLLVRKRRNNREQPHAQQPNIFEGVPPYPAAGGSGGYSGVAQWQQDQSKPWGAGSAANSEVPAYAGFKAELPAGDNQQVPNAMSNTSPRTSPHPSAASPNLSTISRDYTGSVANMSVSNASTLMSGGQGSQLGYISPQHTGTTSEYPGQYTGYYTSGPMTAEMQG